MGTAGRSERLSQRVGLLDGMSEFDKQLSAAAFFAAIKRRAAPDGAGYADPLSTAVWLIQESPDSSECRALRKLLQILLVKEGTFREAEAWLFSGEIAGLTAALIDARYEGRYTEEEWQYACLS